MSRGYLRLAAVVLATVALGWLAVRTARDSLFDLALVTNESMLPHLKPGQRIFINKLSPCFKIPFSEIHLFCRPCEIGRAYLFSHPSRSGQKLVKFAATEPGEHKSAALKRDIIWFTEGSPLEAQTRKVGISCYFEGSNREHSIDSRHFGAVPVEKIDGKVFFPRITN